MMNPEIAIKKVEISSTVKTADKSDYVASTPNHLKLIAYSAWFMDMHFSIKNNKLKRNISFLKKTGNIIIYWFIYSFAPVI
jgi:hypothetical protein